MNVVFEERLNAFLVNTIDPFDLPSLLRFLKEPVSKSALNDLSDYLQFNQLAYLGPSVEGAAPRWISRAGLFTGKSAVVSPTRSDLSAGAFVPASSLVPFANPGLLPHEYSFRYKGEELGKVMLTVSPGEIYPRFAFFGEEYAPQYLACDNEENDRKLSELDYADPIEMITTAFDARKLYWNESFVPGDRVLATLTDWKTATFELSVIHSADVDRDRETGWIASMDAALKECFSMIGPAASIDEQLSFAWYLRQEDLNTPDAPPLFEYLERSSEVALEYFGVETRLWYAGVEIPAQDTWSFLLPSKPETITEEALANLGIPLNERIIQSYVLDGFFLREPDAAGTLERLLPVCQGHASIATPLVERAVRIARSFWENRYNRFADHEKGLLRGRLVRLHGDLVSLVQSLKQNKIRPETIPDQWAIILMQIMTHLIPSMESLDYPADGKNLDLEAAWGNLEGMEEHFLDAQSVIQSLLPILINRRLTVLRQEDDTDEKTKEKPDA